MPTTKGTQIGTAVRRIQRMRSVDQINEETTGDKRAGIKIAVDERIAKLREQQTSDPQRERNCLFLPEEVLPVVGVAVGSRDPRKYLNSVHMHINGEHRTIEATNGLLVVRAQWDDDDGFDEPIDAIVPASSWKEVAEIATGTIEVAKPNARGHIKITINNAETNHVADFLPISGIYPKLGLLLPRAFGGESKQRPPDFNTSIINPRFMAKLMAIFIKMGATSVDMHVADSAVIFQTRVGNNTIVTAALKPLSSSDETSRPLDEDGDIVPLAPEKKDAEDEEDNETQDLFEGEEREVK